MEFTFVLRHQPANRNGKKSESSSAAQVVTIIDFCSQHEQFLLGNRFIQARRGGFVRPDPGEASLQK